MGDRVSQTLAPLGLTTVEPVRGKTSESSTIYDYSGGKHPLTAKWLAHYFGASVVQVPPGTASRRRARRTEGSPWFWGATTRSAGSVRPELGRVLTRAGQQVRSRAPQVSSGALSGRL